MTKIKIFIALTLLIGTIMSSAETITVFTIGDSTMADKPTDNDNQERGWAQMLPDLLTNDISVENHAANGRSSKSFINEGRWDVVMNKLKPGDYVIIQFGHNDEKADTTLHTVPGESFDNNLKRFITDTYSKGATPILMNSIVRRNYPPDGMKEHRYIYDIEGTVLTDTHGEYAEVPRRIAVEMNVPFVDMTSLTHDYLLSLGPERSKQLYMWVPKGKYRFCPDGKIDNTHLNIYGARKIASIAAQAIGKVVPALQPYIKAPELDVSVAMYSQNKRCAVSYTFDDGLAEHYTLVYPELEKRGFCGTFWICGDIIENDNRGKKRLTWKQMKEMSEKGHEISNHSWSHLNLTGKTKNAILDELKKNDSIIYSNIGCCPRTFCYPFNAKDSLSIALASKGRVGTRITQFPIGGEVSHSTDSTLTDWIDRLIQSRNWGVSMIHGITEGYDYFKNPEILWRHLDYVKNMGDDIWVAPFREVASYVKERDSATLSAKRVGEKTYLTISMPLDSSLFSYPLTFMIKNGCKDVLISQNSRIIDSFEIDDCICFETNDFNNTIIISQQ